jgi:hypothetical protein
VKLGRAARKNGNKGTGCRRDLFVTNVTNFINRVFIKGGVIDLLISKAAESADPNVLKYF